MSSVDWASCQTTLECVLYDLLSTVIRSRTGEFDKYCVYICICVRVFGCHSSSVRTRLEVYIYRSIYPSLQCQRFIHGHHDWNLEFFFFNLRLYTDIYSIKWERVWSILSILILIYSGAGWGDELNLSTSTLLLAQRSKMTEVLVWERPFAYWFRKGSLLPIWVLIIIPARRAYNFINYIKHCCVGNTMYQLMKRIINNKILLLYIFETSYSVIL